MSETKEEVPVPAQEEPVAVEENQEETEQKEVAEERVESVVDGAAHEMDMSEVG